MLFWRACFFFLRSYSHPKLEWAARQSSNCQHVVQYSVRAQAGQGECRRRRRHTFAQTVYNTHSTRTHSCGSLVQVHIYSNQGQDTHSVYTQAYTRHTQPYTQKRNDAQKSTTHMLVQRSMYERATNKYISTTTTFLLSSSDVERARQWILWKSH